MTAKNMGWKDYYKVLASRPLRALYVDARSHFGADFATALDLGCGTGHETLDLLGRGFRVHAVDQNPEAIARLKECTPRAHRARLKAETRLLEKMAVWPRVDFVFAFHVLPFVNGEAFDGIVKKSVHSVEPGGIYAATFFGRDDDWVLERLAAGMSRGKVRKVLAHFDTLRFSEIKRCGPTALHGVKYWHFFEVIAKRNIRWGWR